MTVYDKINKDFENKVREIVDEHEQKLFLGEEETNMNITKESEELPQEFKSKMVELPSTFQPFEVVDVEFIEKDIECRISSVSFTDFGKVFYEVLLVYPEGRRTFIERVSSDFISKKK